jgi:hypothetical protein
MALLNTQPVSEGFLQAVQLLQRRHITSVGVHTLNNDHFATKRGTAAAAEAAGAAEAVDEQAVQLLQRRHITSVERYGARCLVLCYIHHTCDPLCYVTLSCYSLQSCHSPRPPLIIFYALQQCLQAGHITVLNAECCVEIKSA